MLCIGVRLIMFCNIYMANCTVGKVLIFGVVLVRIFPHSYWIWRDKNISPYSVQIRENADQNNSKYVHFLRRTNDWYFVKIFFWKKPPAKLPETDNCEEDFFMSMRFLFLTKASLIKKLHHCHFFCSVFLKIFRKNYFL